MRLGKKRDPKYRVVVIDEHKKRSSEYLEKIGTYDPALKTSPLVYDEVKLVEWLKKGAKLSEGMIKLLPKKFVK